MLPVFKAEQIPVIFLTAKTEVDDIVKGLRLGADDYITKPFHLDELAARVEVVLRRRYGGSKELSYEDFTVDLW
ncbi:response regulator [Pediococcus acidilactici]